jgi:hypothetical protein
VAKTGLKRRRIRTKINLLDFANTKPLSLRLRVSLAFNVPISLHGERCR